MQSFKLFIKLVILTNISIDSLSDLGVSSNLIGSLSRNNCTLFTP